MKDSIIGPDEINGISELSLSVPDDHDHIAFSAEEIESKSKDYMLILGCSAFKDGTPVTIRSMIGVFGKDPDIGEPCFYNQDWYNNEDFIDAPLKDGWFFIRKDVYEDSRAVQPDELIKEHSFPSAVTCTYAFFTAWLSLGIKLWYHDFVWCSDTDHNNDRIYVGKYHDVDGINKNGFSIHRHLSLRPCYGCID